MYRFNIFFHRYFIYILRVRPNRNPFCFLRIVEKGQLYIFFQHFRKCRKRNSDGKLFFFFSVSRDMTNQLGNIGTIEFQIIEATLKLIENLTSQLIFDISTLRGAERVMEEYKAFPNKTSSSVIRFSFGLETEKIFELIRGRLKLEVEASRVMVRSERSAT